MKESIIKAVFSTVVTSLMLLFISAIGSIATEPSGQLVISSKSVLDNGYEQTIFMQMWKEPKENIQLSVYGESDIVVSSHITLVKIQSIGEKDYYEVVDLPREVTAYIRIHYNDKAGSVRIENSRNINMTIGLQNKSLLQKILENTIPIIILYFILTLILQYINFKHFEKVKEETSRVTRELTERKKEVEELTHHVNSVIEQGEKDSREKKIEFETKINEIKKKTIAISKSQSKYRIIQSYRLRDMARELDFWYNLVRVIFIKNYGKDESMTRELLYEIRENLKTKKNFTKINDPKSIIFYEKFLTDLNEFE